MSPSFERLRSEGLADDDHSRASAMRCFLEDRNTFQWPDRLDRTELTRCCFDDRAVLEGLFTWERHLDFKKKGGTSWLDQRKFNIQCQKTTKFSRRFVIKAYLNVSPKERDQIVEAENLKDLKFPHVAALLGTCWYKREFWILSYPPGCCDLGDYMASISHELGGKEWRGRPWELELEPHGKKEARANKIHHEYSWPFRESLSQKLTRLRGYFVCLAQALKYLQSANMRHRDLKPDNIIIDLSGSVVVVDFGLAHKFPDDSNHWSQTSTQRNFLVYQAPEVLKNDGRDDPSEIFSLGCIFLEMASLILGKNLQSLEERCRHEVNETGWNYNYGDNLTAVAEWIAELKNVTQAATDDGLAPSPSEMIKRLPTIELMLAEKPQLRPEASKLFQRFDVPPERRCRDCHPDHPEVWRPTQEQAFAATKGAVDRTKKSLSYHEKPTTKKPDLPLSLDDDDFVMIDSALVGRSDTPTLIKEDKKVRIEDAPPSIIYPYIGVPNNSPNSSLDRPVGQDTMPIPLTPETGALVRRQQGVASPPKQPEITTTPNGSPVKHPGKPTFRGNEKIIIYDQGAEEIFPDTTRILRGRPTSEFVGFELPATGTEFHVLGQGSDLLFILDLSRLDVPTKLARRYWNSYRSIYIINFSTTPVQLVDRKRDKWMPRKTS